MNANLLRNQPQWAILAEALLMVVILGTVDFIVGYDVSLFVFYALPIVYTVWFSGRVATWAVCLACSAAWAFADLLSGHPYSDLRILIWNTAVQLGFFVIAMVGASAVKSQINRSRQRVTELERFHILAQISPAGIFRTDAEGRCLYVNEQWCKITGLGQGQALSQVWTSAFHPDDKARIDEGFLLAMETRHSMEFDGRFLRADGSVAWVHGSVARERNAAGGFVGAVMDISEHRRMECEILEIGEREQQRIGQDLHDDLCQFIAAIHYTAASLVTDLDRRGVPEKDGARDVSDLLREALVRTRNLARGIFPVKLEQGGLVSALDELSASAQRAFGIQCVFHCEPAAVISERSAATHLYRIAQESLHNAVRHGKARRVTISLVERNEWITLSVEDDGVGMPPSCDGQGMGLRIMDYRSHMIGGSLKIERSPSGGTVVSCAFHPRKIANPAL